MLRPPIMKTAHIAILSASLLGLLVVGCKQDDDTSSPGEDLGTSESQLVADDSEATETDDDIEAGIDEPLSGAAEDDPGTPADGSSTDELLEKIRANAGRFFKPAGCLVSTRTGNTIAHVFGACTGPYGMKKFTGTISSTYTREAGALTVTHAADGFTANGATVSGSRTVVYKRQGAVTTKTRTGNWSGATAKGKELSHTASFVTAYDASTKCLTRDGSAQTTIGGRSYERSVDGYKRCGIGRLGCPESGTTTLSRTKGDDTTTLTIEFLGGIRYRVTRPNGRQVTRALICNPS